MRRECHWTRAAPTNPAGARPRQETLASWTSRSLAWSGRSSSPGRTGSTGYCTSASPPGACALSCEKLGLHSNQASADPDELVYPLGGASPRLDDYLSRVPSHVPSVRFMNHEAQLEVGGVTAKFEQVTLFRAHRAFLPVEAAPVRARLPLGSSPTYLLLYANGKAAVRVDAPGVRPRGPHFWGGDPSSRWALGRGQGLAPFWSEVSNSTVILHFAYTSRQGEHGGAMGCPACYSVRYGHVMLPCRAAGQGPKDHLPQGGRCRRGKCKLSLPAGPLRPSGV